MNLDVHTILAVGTFLTGTSAAFLLWAWSQARDNDELLWWAAANICNAGAIALMGPWAAHPDWTILRLPSPFLVTLGTGLIWVSARQFSRLATPPWLAAAGPAVFLLVMIAVPSINDSDYARQTVADAIAASLLLAAAGALWRGRNDGLRSLPALTALIVLQAGIGITSILFGTKTFGYLPGAATTEPSGGLAFLVFLVFTCGSAIFVTAMVRERGESKQRRAAEIDSLTGVASRGAFLDAARDLLSRPPARPVTLVLFDLDYFKSINDSFGHAVGDHVLERFGATLRRCLRRDDIAGRLGGEEFAVLLPGFGPEAAYVVAERIRGAFAEGGRVIDRRPVNATVSAGIAASGGGPVAVERLLEIADRALYRAKAKGRNQVEGDERREPPQDAVVIRIA